MAEADVNGGKDNAVLVQHVRAGGAPFRLFSIMACSLKDFHHGGVLRNPQGVLPDQAEAVALAVHAVLDHGPLVHLAEHVPVAEPLICFVRFHLSNL